MSLTYILFLFKNILKSKKNWIVSAIYILFLIVILVLMPLFIKTSSVYVWTNSLLMIQAVLLIPIAICASVLSIGIFKESQDDGTEILILSKPISRIKNVLSKVFVYVIASLVINLIASLSCFLSLLIPYNDPKNAAALFGTNFVVSFILFIFYGALATLISLRLNKTWTVLISVILTVVCNIGNFISPIIFKSPFSSLNSSSDGNHNVQTYHLIGSNGNDNRFGSITNSITTADDLSKSNFLTNFEDAKSLWNEAQKNSSLQKSSYVNFTLQCFLMFNGLWMADSSNFLASQVFASSNYFKYEIKNQFYDKIKTNYNDENLRQSIPSVFYKDTSMLNIENDFASFIQNLISLTYQNNMRSIGHEYGAINLKNTENYLKIGRIENIVDSKYVSDKVRYDHNELYPNEDQQVIFNQFIEEIIKNKHWQLEKENFSNYYTISLNNLSFDADLGYQSIYDYLHSELTTDSNKNLFGINSIVDLNKTILQFKYYLFDLICSPARNDDFKSIISNPDINNLGYLTYQNLLSYRFSQVIGNQLYEFALPIIIPVNNNGDLMSLQAIDTIHNPLINKEWLKSSYQYFFNNADPTNLTNEESLKTSLINWKMLDLVEEFVYPDNKFGFSSIDPNDSSRILYQNYDNLYFVDLNYCWDFGELAFEYDAKEMISGSGLVGIWLSISIIITLVATIVYFKTDFK